MQSTRIKKLFYNILKRLIDSANTKGHITNFCFIRIYKVLIFHMPNTKDEHLPSTLLSCEFLIKNF